MAVTIIVEDGSIVDGANSYLSLADARTRAEVLGVTISTDDDTASAQLVQGAYYNDTEYSDRYQGEIVSASQDMQFPRTGVYIYGNLLDSDVIPQQVKDAQIFTAGQLEAGVNLYPNDDGRSIASNSVGSVSQSYFNNGTTGSSVTLTGTENALKPVLGNGGGKYSYPVYS